MVEKSPSLWGYNFTCGWERKIRGYHQKKHLSSHTIHVWYIYLHLVDFYSKCRQIYHTWILWGSSKKVIKYREYELEENLSFIPFFEHFLYDFLRQFCRNSQRMILIPPQHDHHAISWILITFRAEDSLIFFSPGLGWRKRRNFIWLAYIIMCKKHWRHWSSDLPGISLIMLMILIPFSILVFFAKWRGMDWTTKRLTSWNVGHRLLEMGNFWVEAILSQYRCRSPSFWHTYLPQYNA